jgi:hypothetical protein
MKALCRTAGLQSCDVLDAVTHKERLFVVTCRQPRRVPATKRQRKRMWQRETQAGLPP